MLSCHASRGTVGSGSLVIRSSDPAPARVKKVRNWGSRRARSHDRMSGPSTPASRPKKSWCMLWEPASEYAPRRCAQFSDDGSPSQGTLILFRRELLVHSLGTAGRDKSNPERANVKKTKEQPDDRSAHVVLPEPECCRYKGVPSRDRGRNRRECIRSRCFYFRYFRSDVGMRSQMIIAETLGAPEN
jgi:hypothetical protein